MGLIYIYDQLLLVHALYNLEQRHILQGRHIGIGITFGFCQPISHVVYLRCYIRSAYNAAQKIFYGFGTVHSFVWRNFEDFWKL